MENQESDSQWSENNAGVTDKMWVIICTKNCLKLLGPTSESYFVTVPEGLFFYFKVPI